MNIDELINSALTQTLPGMAEGFFVVEAHAERREFRVLAADEAMKMNLTAFAWGLHTGFCWVGLFTSATAADEFGQLLASDPYLSDSLFPFTADDLWVLEGSPLTNELCITEAKKLIQQNRQQYIAQVSSSFQYMGIYTHKTDAEAIAKIIRDKVRNETGQQLF